MRSPGRSGAPSETAAAVRRNDRRWSPERRWPERRARSEDCRAACPPPSSFLSEVVAVGWLVAGVIPLAG